jgi:predicted peroxiredoxin
MMNPESNILLINLASVGSAPMAKALRFGRKFLAAGWQVHLFLNVDGVYLADPAAVLDPCPVTGKPLTAILEAFLAEGGKGLVGAECMKLIGLAKEDLVPGLEVAAFPLVEALMARPEIKILSW